MALHKSSNAELGVWNVEGWTRVLSGWEVIRDNSVAHGGSWSWITADGSQKGSALPVTPRGSLHFWVFRYWLRVGSLPASGNFSIYAQPAHSSSMIAGLYLGADGRLSAVNATGNYPATYSSPLTPGTWYKIECAIVQQGGGQEWTQAYWRLNDVEFARILNHTSLGAIDGFQTAASGGAIVVNMDDIVINDDTGSTALYWNDADKPRSKGKTIPSVRSTSTPIIGSTLSTSVVVNAPPSIVVGDLLVALIQYGSNTTVTGLPSGWSKIIDPGSGVWANVAVCIKRATSSEPSTYTFGLGATQRSVSTCYALASVDSASPVIDARVSVGTAPSNTQWISIPFLDLSEGDALILQAVAHYASPTITPPTWWTSSVGAKDSTNFQELRAGVYSSIDGGFVVSDIFPASANIPAAAGVAVGFRGVAPNKNKFRSVV